MRKFSSLIAISMTAAWLCGQTPPAQPQAKDKAAKLPPSPLDKVEGYKRILIEGFTVMVSNETLNADVSKFEVKPLEVLAMELKTVVKIMPAKHVDTLRKVLIWIEWDDKQRMGNGRAGTALAVYNGGSQVDLSYEGKNPLKAKAVTVLRMVRLTQEHQPDVESGRCVLLHELAHAVHDQYLGHDHTGILAGYKQAMERKLYDKDQYISTNDSEFFAEATCAYFDQLSHFPKTRDDLKKHDPATHKLLESIWGTAKRPIPAGFGPKPKKLKEINGSDKFDLGITLRDIKFGDHVHGPDFKPADAKGRVLILANFGRSELLVLEKLTKMHLELGSYGCTVVAANTQVTSPEALKKMMVERDILYSTMEVAFFPQKDDSQLRAGAPGHTLVFDAEGKCVFRGSGHDALPHARGAVAALMLSKVLPAETPKAFVALVETMTQGVVSPWEAIPKIGAISQSSDAETSKLAKDLAAVITAPVQAMYVEAVGLVKTDPISAYTIVERITKDYKGAAVTAKASALMDQLKLNQVVLKELQARTMLEPIRKLDTYLTSQPGGFDPVNPRFQRENAASIQQLMDLQAQLRKKHPTSRAADEGGKIASKYQAG